MLIMLDASLLSEAPSNDSSSQSPLSTPSLPSCVTATARLAAAERFSKDDPDDFEDDLDEDARLLEVCMDGDLEDLVALLEDMAAQGETLTSHILNYTDQSGRVRQNQLLCFGSRDSRPTLSLF